MSKKRNLTRGRRPFFQRLLVPRRDLGVGHFLRGYYARIPVYIILFALMGMVATLAMTLSTGGPIDPTKLDLVDYSLRTNVEEWWTGEVYGGIKGKIKINVENFWYNTGYDSLDTKVKLMYPQIEQYGVFDYQSCPECSVPTQGGFPMSEFDSDGSGFLLSHDWSRTVTAASTDVVSDLQRFPGIIARKGPLYLPSAQEKEAMASINAMLGGSSKHPVWVEIEFDLYKYTGNWWSIAKDYKTDLGTGVYPIWQFAIQIADDKAVYSTTLGYDVFVENNDWDNLVIKEGTWEVINGEIYPDLVWPTEGPFWEFIWDWRGSYVGPAEGKLPVPILGDIISAVTGVFGLNIFDTEWSGPIRKDPVFGTLFWITGAEFLFVDVFGLIPYVLGTNYRHSMDMGETFGFWIFKVGFDFLPVLIVGGIIVAILLMGGFAILGPLVTSAVGEVVREIPRFAVTVPRRLIIFILFLLTFILSLFLLSAKLTVGLIILIFAILGFIIALAVGLVEMVTSPFVGIGRTIMGAEQPKKEKEMVWFGRHSKKGRSRSYKSTYQNMKKKIRTKR